MIDGLVVIMTTHNRASLTVRAIRSLEASCRLAGVPARFVVCDDASSDSTVADMLDTGATLEVLYGDGSLFWARGMARAEASALATTTSTDSHLLWLNDDVDVAGDAIGDVLAALRNGFRGVLVGATQEAAAGASSTSYGGYRRRGRHPLAFGGIDPNGSLRPLHTFNGNFVIIPLPIARRLGGIDGRFAHGMADIDFGLRCAAAGINMALLPRPIGWCASNPAPPPAPLLQEWRRFIGIKGAGHPRSMALLLQKHARGTWPIFFASSYLLWWLRAIRSHSAR